MVGTHRFPAVQAREGAFMNESQRGRVLRFIKAVSGPSSMSILLGAAAVGYFNWEVKGVAIVLAGLALFYLILAIIGGRLAKSSDVS